MRRVVTSYTMHRSASGRLTSGVDSSEPDKLRGKVSQMQNVPKSVRDIVVAESGHVLVAADWAGIEWAIAMWMVGKVYNDGYHTDMLDRFYRGELDPHTRVQLRWEPAYPRPKRWPQRFRGCGRMQST